MANTLQLITTYFPELLKKLRWILIDNRKQVNSFGNPINGLAYKDASMVQLTPDGIELQKPHRVSAVSNFQGTLVHEFGHLLAKQFSNIWQEKFSWGYCNDNQEEWELIKLDFGKTQRKVWRNINTKTIAPEGRFPLQPCVTQYAQTNWEEDFCESLVAYFFDPKLLKKTSMEKWKIIHDATNYQQEAPEVKIERSATVTIPQLDKETYYYIDQLS